VSFDMTDAICKNLTVGSASTPIVPMIEFLFTINSRPSPRKLVSAMACARSVVRAFRALSRAEGD
jgi:hypothetical protein